MASMATRRRKLWGWGYEDQEPSPAEVEATARAAREHLGFGPADVERPAAPEDLALAPPRLSPPASLAGVCRDDPHARAVHAYGSSYRDLIRAFRGRFDHPPDLVAEPADESEIEQVLEWCAHAGAAVIPYGGGTSVVGGVEPAVGERYAGAVSLDLRRLNRVLDVDFASGMARIQAGALGPELEDGLRPHGLTLRFYPQSFELSTLGGWIATRAGGHFATLATHVDDLTAAVRALTPAGAWETRRLPGSAAGPSPDRLMLGSEGTLGVITEAWMRVRPRPRWRASASVSFPSFAAGAAAVRELARSGLWPANCRLLDPDEARVTGAASDGALLVLGFESSHHPVDRWLELGLESCRERGGTVLGEPRLSDGEDRASAGRDASSGAGAWRGAFLKAPYLRDTMVAAGIVTETFETAVPWDRLEALVAEVGERARSSLREVCGAGAVTCRLTHAYPDGAAPYFTVLAPARRGAELEQWDEVKAAASEAILAGGGTITHHHAVGRDHRPWYDRQRPEPFAAALHAAKEAVDPAGILNPGVLVDPTRRAV
jgi:alkyldihydroxyacetonephosphate synthase